MSNDQRKRVALYGIGGSVLAALVFAGFVYEADPDVMTVLGAANVQLRTAFAIPAKGPDGRPLSARADLLASAEHNLAIAERIAPGLAVTAEFRGFLKAIRGDHRGAAREYRQAQDCEDCTADQRTTLLFNEVRQFVAAGDGAAALRAFAERGQALPAECAAQRRIEEAAALHQLGRTADAVAAIDGVLATADAPLAWLQAGQRLLAMGLVDRATAAFEQARADVPIADYHLAQLKLARGEVDTCLELLERAVRASPAEVRRRLSCDSGAWQEVATDARFLRIMAPDTATHAGR
jgi:tetratricopeptide (TPR) repeat protein